MNPRSQKSGVACPQTGVYGHTYLRTKATAITTIAAVASSFVAKLGVRFFAGLNLAVATEGIVSREPVRSVLAAAGSDSWSSFVNQIEWGFSCAAEASETCRTDNLTHSFLSGLSA
jgi:hypothetical protein